MSEQEQKAPDTQPADTKAGDAPVTDTQQAAPAKTKAASAKSEAKPAARGVSNDPKVPTADTKAGDAPTPASTDVAAAADNGDGTVDAQAAAEAGRAKREADEAAKGGAAAQVVRQVENGVETDRRSGGQADKSLAGEKLPVLRPNEPDPRQGVTTGERTTASAQGGEDLEEVTFTRGYHLYNRGESAKFGAKEAQRLRDLGVAE